MDFTIITPNLNYGRFLGDCLESVASQMGDNEERRIPSAVVHEQERSMGVPPASSNLPRQNQTQMQAGRPRPLQIEHLVIDGGSTDDSAAVAARFPHARWTQEKDSGMSNAINKGFEQAMGEWVMWLNADDRLKPGILTEVLAELKKSDADLVYGDYDFINETGSLIRRMKVPAWSAFVHIYHHCYIPSTAAFYRNKTVIGQGQRLREDFYYVMDGEFYARLDSIGKKFQHIPINIADFRMHGGNASQRYLGRTRDLDIILAAERQHVESRAIRRAYGITPFEDPYLNGLIDGVLWIAAKGWKFARRILG